MNDILVLGIGNPLLGDDGFGVQVVRKLRAMDSSPPAELLDGGTAGLYLIPHLEGRSHILVVDAVDFGGKPGQVIRLDTSQIPPHVAVKLSEHQVTFNEVLALVNLMGAAPGELLLLGVQPRSTHWGDPLSPEVEAAIPEVLEEIRSQIADWATAL